MGEAQQLVLAQLGQTLTPPENFGGDLRKFVNQARKLGIPQQLLDAPAERPEITNAIAELRAIRASLANSRESNQAKTDDSKAPN